MAPIRRSFLFLILAALAVASPVVDHADVVELSASPPASSINKGSQATSIMLPFEPSASSSANPSSAQEFTYTTLPETVYAADMTPARLSQLEELQRLAGQSGMTNGERMRRGEKLLAPARPRRRDIPKAGAQLVGRNGGSTGAGARQRKRDDPNPSQPANQQFTCANNQPFANCCQTVAGDKSNGQNCFFSFGTYNQQTCSPGYTGLCCNQVNLTGGNGQYTAQGCSGA